MTPITSSSKPPVKHHTSSCPDKDGNCALKEGESKVVKISFGKCTVTLISGDISFEIVSKDPSESLNLKPAHHTNNEFQINNREFRISTKKGCVFTIRVGHRKIRV